MKRFRPRLEPLEDRTAPAILSPAGMQTADLDWDGFNDVLLRNPAGGWAVQHLDGRSLSFRPIAGSKGLANVLSGDFDGDGRADLLGLAADGTWRFARAAGPWAARPWGQWMPPERWRTFLVDDFDGDGRADVAGFSNGGAWWVGLSTGVGLATRRWGQWMPAAGWKTLLVGDFDRNGRADVAGFSNGGAWWVGLSTGAAFRTTAWARWTPAAQWQAVFAADFDGDHRTDVAGLNGDGAWWVAPAVHGGRFATARWATWMRGAGWRGVQVADINGDGRADALGLTHGGDVWVGLSAGRRFVNRYGGAMPYRSLAFGTPLAADFTADSRADLVFYDGGWTVGLAPAVAGSQFLFAVADLSPLSPLVTAWDPQTARASFEAVPDAIKQRLALNTAATRADYEGSYQGVLRGWALEAAAAGLHGDALAAFLAARLDRLYVEVRPGLAQRFPGRSDRDYRALMAMNLAHNYYRAGTQPYTGVSTPRYGGADLTVLLGLDEADCSEYALLLAALLGQQGIDSRLFGFIVDYTAPAGYFFSSHAVVYLDGLWLDAMANVAFGLDLAFLPALPPAERLPALLAAGRVLGFYNRELSGDVRADNLRRGFDPGVIPFFYPYYFAGLWQGGYVKDEYDFATVGLTI